MNRKILIWIGLSVGSMVGSYVPMLWGSGFFSFSSVLGSAVGGSLGIWLGFKIGE